MVDMAAQAVHASRVDYHQLSGENEVAENNLNDGILKILQFVAVPVTCPHGQCTRCRGRLPNGYTYTAESLCVIDSLLCRDAREDFEFVTAENTSRQDEDGHAGEQGGGGEDGGSSEGESGGFERPS